MTAGRPARALALAAALILAVGCSAARKSSRMEGRYSLGKPGDGWSSVRAGGADRAWWNADLSATIYADSNCGVRYEDSKLDSLAEQLTLGLTGREVVATTPHQLDGREALTTRYRGALDGVDVEIGAAVVKKHQCLYDVILIAPPSRFEDAWPAFLSVRDGLRARGD